MNWPTAFVIVTCVWAPVAACFAHGLHRLADFDESGRLDELRRVLKQLKAQIEEAEKARSA